MSQPHTFLRSTANTALAAVLASLLAGCHAIDLTATTPAPSDQEPWCADPPRELAKVSLPAYRIEPPDVVAIEVLKLVPLPNSRISVSDLLEIRVLGAFAQMPIDDWYLVEQEGDVNLGPAYGTVKVAGMTVEEAQEAVYKHLKAFLRNPVVSTKLVRISGTQPVTGAYQVQPDGAINLGNYGEVSIAGKTTAEAQRAVEDRLSQYFQGPRAGVDVVQYNSKNYYVITSGAGQGEQIAAFPVTGNETVLDAISQVQGLSQMSSKTIWVARAAPAGEDAEQVLPVDWEAVTRGALTGTNYQLFPGDRIYIADGTAVACNSFIWKLTLPLERLWGLTALGSETTRNLQTLGRGYNASK